MAHQHDTMVFKFEDSGDIPNNPTLPLVVYKSAVDLRGDEPAVAFENLYPQHGWYAAWRWGVYKYPHYHSNAHEVLGVYRGTASIRLGHTVGVTLVVEPGDVIIIPAGVGHENRGSSNDFHVVGGYPDGQRPDLIRAGEGDRAEIDERIANVALPTNDPVFGRIGHLFEQWGLSTSI